MDLAGRTETTGHERIWRPTSVKWRHNQSHATAHVGQRSNNRPSLLRLDSVGEISSGGLQFTKSKMTPKIALADYSAANTKVATMGNVNNLLTSIGAAFFNIGELGGTKSLANNRQRFRLFSGQTENIPGVTMDEKSIPMNDYCADTNSCDSRTEDIHRLQSTVNGLNTCPGFMAFAPQWYTGSSPGWNGLRVGKEHKLGNKNLWQQPCHNLNGNKMQNSGGQFSTISAAVYPFKDYLCDKRADSTVNMTDITGNQKNGCRRTLDTSVCQSDGEKIFNMAKHKRDLASSFQGLSIGSSCENNPSENQKVPDVSMLVEQCSGKTRLTGEHLEKEPGKEIAVSLPSQNTVQPCASGIRTAGRCLKRTFSYPLYGYNPVTFGSVCVINGFKQDRSVQQHLSDNCEPSGKCTDCKPSYSSVANPSSQGSKMRDSDIYDSIDVPCSGNFSQFSSSVKKHQRNADSALPQVPVQSSNFSARPTEHGQRKPKSYKRPRPSSKKRRRQKARQQSCFVDHGLEASNNEDTNSGDSMQRSKKCKLENKCDANERTVPGCKKDVQGNSGKQDNKPSCSPVSFIPGVGALQNDEWHAGTYKEYSVSVLVDGEESEFSEFEDDGCDGGDFSMLQDFFPHCGGLNPLNFKVSISISPSTECGPASPRQPGARGLDAINWSWVNICDTSKSKPKSSKKVQFAPDDTLATVHPMIAWSYAYQAARKGPWEEYARDRERFSCRLRDAECMLNPVLQHEHRKLIQERNFSNQ